MCVHAEKAISEMNPVFVLVRTTPLLSLNVLIVFVFRSEELFTADPPPLRPLSTDGGSASSTYPHGNGSGSGGGGGNNGGGGGSGGPGGGGGGSGNSGGGSATPSSSSAMGHHHFRSANVTPHGGGVGGVVVPHAGEFGAGVIGVDAVAAVLPPGVVVGAASSDEGVGVGVDGDDGGGDEDDNDVDGPLGEVEEVEVVEGQDGEDDPATDGGDQVFNLASEAFILTLLGLVVI